jgi:DNA repair ATPase RecN
MASPVTKYKDRLTHAINLRIEAKLGTTLTTIESLEERVRALENETQAMRSMLADATVGLTDQQRATGELLEQTIQRVELVDQARGPVQA